MPTFDEDQKVILADLAENQAELVDQGGGKFALPVEGLVGTLTPADPQDILRTPVLRNGSSDLTINGSSTTRVFVLGADPTKDIRLDEIRYVFESEEWKFEPGGNFGGENDLSDGLLFEVEIDGTATELANLQRNADILLLQNSFVPKENDGAGVAYGSILLGGKPILRAGTADEVRVSVRDNLNRSKFTFMEAWVYGIKVAT